MEAQRLGRTSERHDLFVGLDSERRAAARAAIISFSWTDQLSLHAAFLWCSGLDGRFLQGRDREFKEF